MDTSRLTPMQIQMQMNKIRNEQQKEQKAKEIQDAQDKASTQNGTGYRGLHDLMNQVDKKKDNIYINNK